MEATKELVAVVATAPAVLVTEVLPLPLAEEDVSSLSTTFDPIASSVLSLF